MSQEASIAQAAVEEAAAAEAKPEATPEPDISAQFAEMKKKERDARAERNNLKRELEEAKRGWAESLKKDPVGTLKSYGVTTDSLASALLEPEAEEPKYGAIDPEIKAKLDRLETERQDRLLADFRKDVFAAVEKDPDKFELLLNTGNGKDLYWKAVVDYYQAFNEAPDYAELAQEIENALEADTRKLLGLKRFKPAEVEAPKPEEKVPKAAEPAQESEPSEFVTLSKKLTPDAFGRKTKVTPVQDRAPKSIRHERPRTREQLRQDIINKYLKD